MEANTQRYEAETINEGIDSYGLEFSSNLHFGFGLKNVTQAQKEGLTPRYGMSFIPYQSFTGEIAATDTPGLMNAEGATYSYANRRKVFGCIPISYGSFDDVNIKKQHYIWICSSDQINGEQLDYCISSEYDSGVVKYRATIATGLSYDNFFARNNHRSQRIKQQAGVFSLERQRQLSDSPASVRSVSFTNSGKTLRKKYWVGKPLSAYPDTSTRFGLPTFDVSTLISSPQYGTPYPINSGKYKKGDRSIQIYALSGSGLNYRYDYTSKSFTENTFVKRITKDETETVFNNSEWGNADSVTGPDDGSSPAFGTSILTLYTDSEMTMSSGYTAIVSAANKAYCAILQEQIRGHDNLPFQYCDLTRSYLSKSDFVTSDNYNSGRYREESRVKATCWNRWPSVDASRGWTTPTLAAIEAANGRTSSTNHVCLGAANSGILRANTDYEFTYSIYDYSTDYECNVGTPSLVRTGANDNVCLYLYLDGTQTGAAPVSGANEYLQVLPATYANSMPINTLDFDNGSMPINYLEIRIYYREKGTFEWLPAGRTEWTNYFYNPDQGEYAVCTGKETGLPGGQPGGYNDYSELPDEDWQDVITFNNRVFWASKSQVIFSNRNNVFAYAARNTIPCPKGEFRGIKVHTFYGESEQNGRVIIFGSEETYFGEFTGNKIIEPIRVSIDNVGEFPVDGSDFDVKTRSTITAFSSRSATVADGILYFWGQSGIYADNGVGTPEKISLAIEPELFDLYDKNKTLDIHCNYNANTKEIVWYFTPADTSEGLTKMLVYNIKTAKYLIWTHEKKIDWAESIKIENEQVGRLISGPRTIVGTRENASGTISRSVFFDHFNKTADFAYGTEFAVKEVTNPAGSTYRFTFAGGFDAALLASVNVGDKFATPNMREYSEQPLADCPRAIWEVTSVGADYVEALIFGSLSQFTASLTPDKYFPIYFENIHGFEWVIETNKWAPAGLRFLYVWIFYHMLWLVDLLTSEISQTINVAYRGNLPDQVYKTRVTTLEDNSGGFCQRLDQTIPENEVNWGQSIQFKLSGSHLGGVYALQYVAVEGQRQEFGHTQRFESE